MKELNKQTIIDYTAVPAGWLIKGHLWTGQSTQSTITCSKCGRISRIFLAQSQNVTCLTVASAGLCVRLNM